MKLMKLFKVVAPAILMCALSAQANLVVDGGFESGAVSGSFSTYGVGAMGGWNVTAGSVDLIGSLWPAQEGSQSLDLSGNVRGTISQTITLSAGTYDLSFWMSGNQGDSLSPKTVEVSVTPTGLGATTFSTTLSSYTPPSSPQWEQKNTSFSISSAGNYLLQFKDVSLPSSGDFPALAFGAALDNICLTAVPEPTTMIAGAMLLLPFGASMMRKLRKTA